MARLDGKVAVITGATGGIGRAASRLLFTDEGAKVALVDLDEAALREVAQSIGEDKASYTVADVTQPDQTQAYIDAAVNRWGGIDALLANAGIEGTLSPIPDYPVEVFDRVMAVNVQGRVAGHQVRGSGDARSGAAAASSSPLPPPASAVRRRCRPTTPASTPSSA